MVFEKDAKLSKDICFGVTPAGSGSETCSMWKNGNNLRKQITWLGKQLGNVQKKTQFDRSKNCFLESVKKKDAI